MPRCRQALWASRSLESYTARQQVAKETILRLREKGHYVHIDDFGTGYSSLAYLHDLSVDAIKIDKAFTRAIGTDAVTVTILPQILTMADTLGLRVVVEGVETPEQAQYFARADQSIYAQGWLFGRPVPPDVFRRMLEGKESSERGAACHGEHGRFARTRGLIFYTPDFPPPLILPGRTHRPLQAAILFATPGATVDNSGMKLKRSLTVLFVCVTAFAFALVPHDRKATGACVPRAS